MSVVQYSCFVEGTPVMTSTGARPIEQIKPGDEVLSQAVDSGELAYHPVQTVTLRPASALVKITLGSQSLLATRGHPFWVDGQGWTMAKQLKAGQVLHSLDGAVVIDSLEEAPAQEAYNLVVADGSTYFVGERPVLVHDNKPLVTTMALVPGLLRRARPDNG